jgi:hypothetical protein
MCLHTFVYQLCLSFHPAPNLYNKGGTKNYSRIFEVLESFDMSVFTADEYHTLVFGEAIFGSGERKKRTHFAGKLSSPNLYT